jgi:hypothetical protein
VKYAASASSVLADQARAAIAETKAQWWQGHIPSYLQWSSDIGAQEATYTAATTDNTVQRATLIKNAGVAYAEDVGTALKAFETANVAARSSYLVTVMPFYLTAADKTSKAHRDLEMDMADAELNKQLTGNNSVYEQAVEDANTRHTNTVTQANEELENALKPERKKRDDLVTAATKDKEAAIAKEEREYQEAIAAIDAQYGTESAGGDTGTEGATRRAAIATRDAQYYADRDTSWASTLSGSTALGNSPWSVKAISDANAQAAFSTSRASAQAAHDAAMLDAVEDWQLSSRDSLTNLLFAEGQSRETFSVATANVYADWENGVGNLLGDKPEGTEWGVGVVPNNEGNGQRTGGGFGYGRAPLGGWATNEGDEHDGQEQESGEPTELPEELPIPKRENSYYQVWKNTDDLDNEIAARRMGMIIQPNRRRFFEEEIAQLEEARNVIVGPRQSILLESYKDWNKNSRRYYNAAWNGEIQTDALDTAMYRTGALGRGAAVLSGTTLVIVTSGGTMTPVVYGGLVAYELDQAQAGVRSIYYAQHVDSLGGTAIGNIVGHDTTEGEALKIGYDLAGLAGLARAPWRLTITGEIVADSGALGKVMDDAPASIKEVVPQSRVSLSRPNDSGIELDKLSGPFYHGDTPEAVELIVLSRRLRGEPPRNFFKSDIPAAKAFEGQMPEGYQGVEFMTYSKPDISMNGLGGRQVWWRGENLEDFKETPIIILRVGVRNQQ